MAETKIEWTERTWNPVVGCSIHSPGCKNCYAMRMAARLEAMAVKPDGDGNPALNHYVGTTESSRRGAVWTGKIGIAPDDAFTAPLRRKKPTDYFVNSMSDLFHKDVPFEVVDRVFAVMALSPQHTYKILTKRSDRMLEYFQTVPQPRWMRPMKAFARDFPRPEIVHPTSGGILLSTVNGALPNVWLGVSIENRDALLNRATDLGQTPAAVRFWSAEPLLEDLGQINPIWLPDWVIVGGESGPGARPMHPDWARSLRDQCSAAGVPFHFKQWGEYASVSEVEGPGEHYQFPDGATVRKVGKKRAGRLLDGVEHNGFPGQVEGEGRK